MLVPVRPNFHTSRQLGKHTQTQGGCCRRGWSAFMEPECIPTVKKDLKWRICLVDLYLWKGVTRTEIRATRVLIGGKESTDHTNFGAAEK